MNFLIPAIYILNVNIYNICTRNFGNFDDFHPVLIRFHAATQILLNVGGKTAEYDLG